MEVAAEEGSAVFVDQRMYRDTCDKLAALVQKITNLFPALEAVQPPKSGIQALCGLHWALDKANTFLQQVLRSSKLYLAITNDSVLVKFERVKECLDQSLRRLQLNFPEALAEEVAVLVAELEETTCQLNASDQDAGNKIISLLQKEKESPGYNAVVELDMFNEVASELGIASNKAVLAEKKALRRLLDKVRNEEDKKKELIVLYLLHLLRRYGKVHTFSTVEDGSLQEVSSSCPASPSERGSEASTSGRDSDFSSELSCFEVHRKGSSCLGNSNIPPEEFRCPISLQLMSDPVIISSGQTYERICIEKWFEEGHNTCPKTQQKLAHLGVTPNYCVKGLITSWCERQSLPIPNPPSPPPSPIANWRWDLLSESASKKPLDTRLAVGELLENECLCMDGEDSAGKLDVSGKCCLCSQALATNACFSLTEEAVEHAVNGGTSDIQIVMEQLRSSSLERQCRAAEEIRFLTKDNADARIKLASLGSIPALVGHLSAAMNAGDESAQVTACFALSNMAVHNNRNREDLVNAGVIPMLLNLLGSDATLAVREAAILVLLTVSCVEEDKLRIGLSGAVPYLVDHIESGSAQGVKDAVSTLFNLSAFPENQLCLVNAISKLIFLLNLGDSELTGKCLTILYSLSSIEEGRSRMMEADGCISSLVEILDSGTLREKEQVAAILLVVSTNNAHHTQLVLQEGIIPSLVMLSVNGSARGKDKAQKLLQHFREQRQKESAWHSAPQVICTSKPSEGEAQKGAERAVSGRKVRSGPSFGFFRRSKSLSFYRC